MLGFFITNVHRCLEWCEPNIMLVQDLKLWPIWLQMRPTSYCTVTLVTKTPFGRHKIGTIFYSNTPPPSPPLNFEPCGTFYFACVWQFVGTFFIFVTIKCINMSNVTDAAPHCKECHLSWVTTVYFNNNISFWKHWEICISEDSARPAYVKIISCCTWKTDNHVLL